VKKASNANLERLAEFVHNSNLIAGVSESNYPEILEDTKNLLVNKKKRCAKTSTKK
jgi:hypothetical protein